MKSIGDRIREGRTKLGLTQPDLAKLAKVSKGTISMWETGVNQPKGVNLFNVAAALKMNPSYILTGKLPKNANGPFVATESENASVIEEAFQIISGLDEEDQKVAVEILRALARRGLREPK